jgi:hypothetical protein
MKMHQIIELAKANNGITYSFKNEMPKRYVVAVDREKKFPILEERGLYKYVADNKDLLDREGHFLGLWLNDGVWYADVSVDTNRLEFAVAIGQAFNQKAIWDNVNQQELFLKVN